MKFQTAVVLTLLCFIPMSALFAQSDAPPPLTFNHLALSVKDVNRSAEFYRNVLGLTEIANRARLDGVRWFS